KFKRGIRFWVYKIIDLEAVVRPSFELILLIFCSFLFLPSICQPIIFFFLLLVFQAFLLLVSSILQFDLVFSFVFPMLFVFFRVIVLPSYFHNAFSQVIFLLVFL